MSGGVLTARTSVAGRGSLRAGPTSWVVRPRHAVVLAGLGLGGLLLGVVGLLVGEIALSPAVVVDVLSGAGSRIERFVVLDVRLPRVLAGALAGLGLGAAGALSQTVTRNPLATPDVLGVTFGASAAAVAVLVLGGGTATGVAAWAGLPLAALAGGLGAAALIYVLAWRDGVDGLRLVLIGIAVGSMLYAATSWLLLEADLADLAQAQVWLTGSLAGRGWEHVVPVALAVVVFGAGALACARDLGAQALGPDVARSLGVRVERAQLAALGCAVALAAVATAAVGPIAFVALAAPQVALRLVGAASPPIGASAVAGAALVLAADAIARGLLPVELPVGVVTAVLGAPYLVLLLVRTSRRVSA